MDFIVLLQPVVNLSSVLCICKSHNGHEIFLYTKATQFSAWCLFLLVRYLFYEKVSIDISTKGLP